MIPTAEEMEQNEYMNKEFETTDDYWDCDCEDNYIHPIEQKYCPICDSHEENYPSSRVNEVGELLLRQDKSYVLGTLEQIRSEFFSNDENGEEIDSKRITEIDKVMDILEKVFPLLSTSVLRGDINYVAN